jgi:hypothetical protein
MALLTPAYHYPDIRRLSQEVAKWEISTPSFLVHFSPSSPPPPFHPYPSTFQFVTALDLIKNLYDILNQDSTLSYVSLYSLQLVIDPDYALLI